MWSTRIQGGDLLMRRGPTEIPLKWLSRYHGGLWIGPFGMETRGSLSRQAGRGWVFKRTRIGAITPDLTSRIRR